MIEKIFRVVMYWRVLYGILKISFGAVLLHYIGQRISYVFLRLMRRELVEDPKDILVHQAAHLLGHIPYAVTYFLASYFIFWGVMDVFLSYNLLKHRLWAFPFSVGLISLFVFYELYRFTHTHSLMLLFMIVFDGVVIYIIHKEYLKLKQKLQPPAAEM